VREISFADGFDQPDVIALGLGAPQLGVVAGGAVLAYLALHAPVAPAVQVVGAVAVAATAATLGWGRLAGRPLLTWAWLGLRHLIGPRSGGEPTTVPSTPADPSRGSIPVPGPPPEPDAASLRRPAALEAVSSASTDGDASGTDDDPSQPAWTRWLRVDRPARNAEAQPVHSESSASTGTPNPARRQRLAHEPEERFGGSQIDRASPPSTDVEISRRTPLVLLPAPVDRQEDTTAGDVLEVDDSLDEPTVAPQQSEGVTAVGTMGEDFAETLGDDRTSDAPIFVGATRRVTFFSLNGGAGRSTLATEVAALLAARGRCRGHPDDTSAPLRVALLDLDLRSANVAVRLGIPQPTLWDYLNAGDPRRLDDFLVTHRSGLRVLLGPPKPLSTHPATAEPARIAEVVHQLEREGTHFIVFDLGADLGAVTTWVLSAVHDIFVVITPNASGVQDAYRTTEALRRLGLGHKLRYVVNRCREQVDLTDTMADLGGRVVATIPYDPRIEEAENAHRCITLDGGGRAAEAIRGLAAQLYPALSSPPRTGRLNFFRRHAG